MHTNCFLGLDSMQETNEKNESSTDEGKKFNYISLHVMMFYF